MKHINHLLCTIALVFAAITSWSYTPPPVHDITGEWAGVDNKGKKASFIFAKTGHLSMVMDGQLMDGHPHDKDGKTVEIKYELDETKKPMWIDFVFYVDGKRLDDKTAKGIFRYLNDNKIELHMDFESTNRYDKFDAKDKDNTIFLTRKVAKK